MTWTVFGSIVSLSIAGSLLIVMVNSLFRRINALEKRMDGLAGLILRVAEGKPPLGVDQ